MDSIVDNRGTALQARIEGEGPDLLLIHGVGNSLDVWDDITELLADSYRIIRLDIRGHGRSDKPAGPYHLDDFVSDAVAVLDHFGVERCHVAGHSLGALIAQGLGLARPGRVDRLILLSGIAGRNDEERRRVEERLAMVADGIPGDHFEASLSRWFTDEFRQNNPDVIAAQGAANRRNDPAAYAAAYRVLARTDLADRLHEIRAPVLIATGDGDIGSNPRMARLMHERIPGSSLRILDNLRHALLTEAPDRVAGLIREFLD